MRAMRCSGGWGLAEIECGEDRGFASSQCSVLESLRMDDGFQIEQRRLKQSVDYNEVEMPGLGHLDAGVGKALGDDLRCVLASPGEAVGQLVPTWRQDEDQDGVRKQLLDLQRTLPVDLEHHVLTALHALLDAGPRGAVEVAVHLGPFEEVAVGNLPA